MTYGGCSAQAAAWSCGSQHYLVCTANSTGVSVTFAAIGWPTFGLAWMQRDSGPRTCTMPTRSALWAGGCQHESCAAIPQSVPESAISTDTWCP